MQFHLTDNQLNLLTHTIADSVRDGLPLGIPQRGGAGAIHKHVAFWTQTVGNAAVVHVSGWYDDPEFATPHHYRDHAADLSALLVRLPLELFDLIVVNLLV